MTPSPTPVQIPPLQEVQSFDTRWLAGSLAGLVLDLFGFVQTVNPALEGLLGSPATELKGLSFQHILHVGAREYETLWAHIQRGQVWQGYLTLRNLQRVEARILPDIPEKSTLPLQFLVVLAPVAASGTPGAEPGTPTASGTEVAFLRSALRQQERINEELTRRLVLAQAAQQDDTRHPDTEPQTAVPPPPPSPDTGFERTLVEQLCALRMQLARVEAELTLRPEHRPEVVLERQRNHLHELIAVLDIQRGQVLVQAQAESDRRLAEQEQALTHQHTRELDDRDRYHEELVTRLRLQFSADLQAEREKIEAERGNPGQPQATEHPAPSTPVPDALRVFFSYLAEKVSEPEERSLFAHRIKTFIAYTDGLPDFDADTLQVFKKAFIQLMVKRG